MTFLAELERLKGAATDGPWYLLSSPWLDSGLKTCILSGSPDPHVAKFICDFQISDDNEEDDDNSWEDAELLIFLRNHADALAELVRAAEKRAVHRECEDSWYSCPKSPEGCANPGEGEACNCGADDLINALAALDKERK